MLRSDFNTFHKQIELMFNKWFPKSKECKDEEIANLIFRQTVPYNDMKIWIKYSMVCLLNSSKRIYENILYYQKHEKYELFIRELELLKETSFEATIFMEFAFHVIEEKKVDFGRWKRSQIDSFETFSASKQILRKNMEKRSVGNFVLGPSSIILLRQAIELWLYEIFGIKVILDDKAKIVKLQPERLF